MQTEQRAFICGTRRAETLALDDHRVYCATCHAGGTVRHATRDQATKAAVRDSNRPCRTCRAQ